VTYELRDHTADVAVEATADSLSALFAAVANGLTAASAESVPAAGERFELEVASESREALLFDYLDRLIYERDVRLVLPADHRCTVREPGEAGPADESADAGEWRLAADARGVPLDAVAAREIKAVTYSEMALEPREDGWYAYVVFDV
jgi:SHS2 domain-containing protein